MRMIDGLGGTLTVVELISHDGLFGTLGFLLVDTVNILLGGSGLCLLGQVILGILIGSCLSTSFITTLVQQVSTFFGQELSPLPHRYTLHIQSGQSSGQR